MTKELTDLATGSRRVVRGSRGVGSLWPNAVIRPAAEVQVEELSVPYRREYYTGLFDDNGQGIKAVAEGVEAWAVLARLDESEFVKKFGSIHATPWNETI